MQEEHGMSRMIDMLARSAFATALLLASAGAARAATDAPLPMARQNELVKTYCAACHDDAKMIGGLSLEHFDAAQADPTIAAMLLSKMTNGLRLEIVRAADADSETTAMVERELKSSALGAAGVPPPDAATALAWVSALAKEASGAAAWTSHHQQAVQTASIIREMPLSTSATKANIYRLAVTCRPDTREGTITLTWAPGDLANGRELTATADGGAVVTPKLARKAWQGNLGPTSGIGSVVLYSTRDGGGATITALPAKSVTVANLLADQRVSFSFDELGPSVRQALSACFTVGTTAQ
jgi:hypothetical protein